MFKIKDMNNQPKRIEDYKPGATKAQVFKALCIAATTQVKPDSKKPF